MMTRAVKIGFVVLIALLMIATAAIIYLVVAKTADADTDTSDDSLDNSDQDEQGHRLSAFGVYRYAAVADDVEVCSTVGTYILAERQGSVVDAAVATGFCNGVINQQLSGIGGGNIMVIHDRPRGSQQSVTKVITSREAAPSFASPEFISTIDGSRDPKLIAVPAEVAGLYKAHQEFGRLPWSELVAPSVTIAREGWRVTNIMSTHIETVLPLLTDKPNVLRDFMTKEDGSAYKEGDLLKDPKLADTLQIIADQGVDSFKNGALLDLIIQDLKEAGTNFSAVDFETLRPPKMSDPVTFRYGDLQLLTSGLPGSGIVVGHALQVMKGYNYSKDSLQTDEDWALFYHRYAETFKILSLQRQNLGDSDEDHAQKWFSIFQDASKADEIRSFISDDQVSIPEEMEMLHSNDNISTSHYAIYGPEGSAVSVTTTVGNFFGCKMKGRRTGIVFNSGMNLFSDPQKTNVSSNYARPNKSGRSSTSPVMLMDDQGKVVMGVGGAGGTRIFPAVTWVIMLSQWLKKNVSEAVDFPRVFAPNSGDTLYYDEGIPKGVLESLKKRGHKLIPSQDRYSYLAVVQAFDSTECKPGLRETPCIMAVSDYRKKGKPDGY